MNYRYNSPNLVGLIKVALGPGGVGIPDNVARVVAKPALTPESAPKPAPAPAAPKPALTPESAPKPAPAAPAPAPEAPAPSPAPVDYSKIFGKNFNPGTSKADTWLKAQADKLRAQNYSDAQISTMLNPSTYRRFGRKGQDYVVDTKRYSKPLGQ